MNKFLKRGLSTLLALALSLSGLSISASEDQPNAQQDETASQGETVGTEPTKYQVHLPTLTGLSYGYDVLRLGKNQDPNETVLLYEAEEEVNLTLNGTEGYKILQVKVQPLQEDPILSTYQAPQLTFSMPSKDVWIEPSLEATPPVPESEHLETDPVQSETSLPQSESETTFIQDPILETESQETPEETGDKPQTETPKPLQTETAQTEATQTEATQTEVTQTGMPQDPQTQPSQDGPPQEDPAETTPNGAPQNAQTEESKDEAPREPQTETTPETHTESHQDKTDPYALETEGDGLPPQGSIVSVDGITLPFDTWDFDPYKDFQNIGFEENGCTILYVSDDILYDVPGTYSSIYRVDSPSGKFWFVLRPVTVSPEAETPIAQTEAETQEEPETNSRFSLYVTENEYATVTPEKDSYQEGETVQVEVAAKEGYMVTGLNAQACLPAEKEGTFPVSDYVPVEKTESIAAAKDMESKANEKSAKGQEENSDASGDINATYTFTMPNFDVLLTADTQSSVRALSLSPRSDEEAVPDKFKLVVKGQYSAPSGLKAGNAATTYKTVVFLEDDGTTTTRMAYCIQPRQGSPGSGTTYDKDKAVALSDGNSMAKAMYYLYGGPAWGKTIQLANGNSVNLKTLLTDAGCTSTGHYYTMTHYILSYIYMKGENWNWNSNEGNVLNSKGVALVKEAASYLSEMDKPSTALTETSLTASNLSAGNSLISGSTTYKAIEENTATISLPVGITLVNETSGKSATGTASIAGGDTFHFEVSSSYSGSNKVNLQVKCKYAVDFTAFKLEMSGYQDIGFSYYSGDKTLPLTLEIQEKPKNYYAQVQKIDAVTGTATPLNTNYSLAGAEYTIYTDANCTTPVTTLVTQADGKSQVVELKAGTYYAKETKASPGYRIDHTVHPISVKPEQTVTFTSKEVPITGKIRLQKKDANTGKPQPYNEKVSFEGAQYTVYSDAGCKNAVETLTTNASGFAQSGTLPIATYYVKETKEPVGYQLDPKVYTVSMNFQDPTQVYPLESLEQVIRKPIEIQKIDKETGKPKPYNDKVSFANATYTIYTDSGCKNAVGTMSTNASGYGKSDPLPLATYYVKETKQPSGYELDPQVYTVNMQAQDSIQVYPLESLEQVIRKPIEIQKIDKETGKPKPYNDKVSFANATYTIYTDSGCKNAVGTMSTNASGYGKSDPLPLATYYVKETKRPSGYELDPQVYTVNMQVQDSIQVYPLESLEQVIRKPIEIQKVDKETGEAKPNHLGVSFSNATYTVYSDQACTKTVETLSTNASGYAKSRPLVIGTYYLKETKAPEGYLLDETVYTVNVADDQNVSYRVTSKEQVIRGSFMLMKYLDDSYDNSTLHDWVESGKLKGIRFTLTHEDPDIAPVKITTDEYGYAATKDKALVYGTWLIQEDPDTTPEGYAGLEKAEIHITEDGVELKYIVTNDLQDGRVKIVKKDADTGNVIPLSGAKFQILDAEGTPIEMPDNLDYSTVTDTFTTNQDGVIFLTKALRPGTYTLKEVVAPEGYQIHEPFPFVVEGKSTYDAPLVVACLDRPQMGWIRIKKTDAATGEQLGEGFTFEIRTAADIVDASGEIRKMVIDGVDTELKAGILVAKISTDGDGIAKSPKLYLGDYRVQETLSAEHYAMDDTEYPVTLSYDAAVETVTTGLKIQNQKTAIDLVKVDAESSEENELPLAGIHFRIFTSEELDAAGGLVGILPPEELAKLGTEYVTDENGRIHIEDLKHNTVYYLFESETIPGYNLESNLYKVTVDETGRIDGKPTYTLKIANVANLVDISKKELSGEDELPGATLTVKDGEGNVVDTWVSTDTPHRIKGLTAGTYTLTEEAAPEGYAIAKDLTFTLSDSLEVQQVTMFDRLIQVAISKKDITGTDELPGATLVLTDSEEKEVERWTSGDEPHFVNLPAGTYTLTETMPPKGYATAESITFTVYTDLSVQQVTMYDQPLQIEISKKDSIGEDALPGATLAITDSEGNMVESWISSTQPHKMNLPVGEYTLTELSAPTGYATAESMKFEVIDTREVQKVEMLNQPLQIEISKKDLTNKQELPGARLTVTDKEGNLLEEWTSTEEPHMMNLPAGEYVLTEVAAPEGYAKAESVPFTVTDTMELQKVEMLDQPIQVEISKKDLTNKKELPGAKLMLKDNKGNTVEEWTSTEEPHKINLPAGKYTLLEVTAPQGYEVSEEVNFEVTDSLKVQPVTMYDAPKEETVDLTGKKETKTIRQDGSTPYAGGSGESVTAAPVRTGDPLRYLPAAILLTLGAGLWFLARRAAKKKKR